MSKYSLPGRFRWLLEEMCRKCGIDVQMVDYAIDFWENKANIEGQTHKRLFLKPEKKQVEEEEKRIREIVEAYEEWERESQESSGWSL